MNNSVDRQGILDNLTAIETTAKLLVNAFVKKNHDKELSLNGIHREELITQTTTFLSQAQKLILNLSNTLNLATDGFHPKPCKENLIETIEELTSTPLLSDVSQHDENEKDESKGLLSKKTFSLSTITLDDIIQNRLAPKHILPNYPLLHDPVQPNLVSLIRSLRSIDNVDDLMTKAYSKIFNHEERICCNYNGTNGKLPYPRHKRLLLDLIIKLILHERNKTFDDDEKNRLYSQCEKQLSTDTALTKYGGPNIDHLTKNRSNNEEEYICSLFRLIIPNDDIKRIISAKQDISSQWNDNELCIYYARPIHLLWIKQKWLEQYPSNSTNEAARWSQCIDWAIDSFLEKKTKTRPSKRKTQDISTDHKRTKTSLTIEEKIKQIDRTKFHVLEYADQLLHFISDKNNKNLPTLEQLQFLEQNVFHFYWTPNQEETWSHILDMISHVFLNELNENFRHSYGSNLFEINSNDQSEIERLLQIKL